jgi:hypothetical protein
MLKPALSRRQRMKPEKAMERKYILRPGGDRKD